jgi:aldehyde:ferredoxin oxidoreductase
MAGFCGKILWIDLTSGRISEEIIEEKVYRQYFGGYGLGAKILFEKIPQGADPLGPDNILGFCEGLLTGSIVPFTGRYMVVTKSPLTGGWGDANSGGFFGSEIRRCGYDGFFFKGISKTPVYLLFQDGKAQLLDAAELWGLDAVETDNFLQDKHGKKVKVASIGQAGEKQCLNACIVNDKGRVAGRSGVGAVMGSKNLKAVALVGHLKYEYHDQKAVSEFVKGYQKRLKKYMDSGFTHKLLDIGPKFAGVFRRLKMPIFSTPPMAANYFHLYGTSYSTAMSAEIGDSPIKNWDGVGYLDFPQNKVRNLAGSEILKWKKRPYGCFACPVQCGAILSVPELKIEETHRPEYETLSTFGSLILNHDLMKVFEVNDYLNRVGLDSISAGGIVAFAIECFEHGIISEAETGGLQLKWGETDFIMPLLKMIVNRKNIGNILADGVKKAAEKLGKGAEAYAIHAGGQELPMHDPKHTPSLATTYAVDPTPGRHTAASIDFMEVGPIAVFLKGTKIPKHKRYDYGSKGAAQAKMAKIHQALNSLGFCIFGTWNGRMEVLEMLEGAVGWKITLDELEEIGYRIQTLRQQFNVREGALHHHIHPRSLGIPPQTKGPLKAITLDVEIMVKDYYTNMGWEPLTGIPTETTLSNLDLQYAKIRDNATLGNKPVAELPKKA